MIQARCNRVVLLSGSPTADALGRAQGRGAYICTSLKCLETAIRKGGFARTFRTAVAEVEPEGLAWEFYTALDLEMKRSGKREAEAPFFRQVSTRRKFLLARLKAWEKELKGVGKPGDRGATEEGKGEP